MSGTVGRQPYVFISYASADRERVLPLVERLEAAGVSAWIDRDGIQGGANYALEIVNAIRGSAALVLMCSQASFASHNVRQEIALAWKYRIPYLPLLLEQVEVPSDLEYWLEGTQWIEAYGGQSDHWLVQSVSSVQRLLNPDRPIDAGGRSAKKPGPSFYHLPIPPTTLLGREREMTDLLEMFHAPGTQLVTLTGTGGVGKTRLALEVGRHLSPDFSDGVVFVDLAPIKDANLVASTVATAFGLRLMGGNEVDELLAGVLKHLKLLLLLDNFEQVLDASPLLAKLLAVSPSLKILVTSRAPLRLRAEHEYLVSPLQLPAVDSRLLADDTAAYGAVALFVDRARSVKPGFDLNASNIDAVVEICRRLDGIPLAIELAASRVRVLPPKSLLDRLAQRLPLLTGSLRDLPQRQQTLRDAIGWSYDLLPPPEQALFRRLAVFAGGWTLEAAESVLGHDIGCDVLDGLALLFDHNLIQQQEMPDGSSRYRMLETLWEYAWEQFASNERWTTYSADMPSIS